MNNNIKHSHKTTIFNMVQPTPSLHTWQCQLKSIILIWIVITLNQTHRLKKKNASKHKQNHMHTNSQSQSSNTPNNALTRNRQILKLLFEETRSMFFKESSLVPMWEGPWAKVTKPFAIMPIYKASILFLDGQGIPNYLFNKELCYTPRKKRSFS